MILDDILNLLKIKSNNIAYTVNGNCYTYNELYSFVCNIYNYLLDKNPNKKPIIVYGHKEVYMKATILACSFAGMTYVPIDKSLPDSRVLSIINQVNPEILIGDFLCEKVINISQVEIEKLMNKDNIIEIEKIYLDPNDIYYIIFTSGSTGIPKGVKVTYNNLDSCVKWLKNIINIDKKVILNQAAFSFDLSVADFYLSLVSQSNHFILENKIQVNFKLLFEELEKSGANIAVFTPSFVDMLLIDKAFNKKLLPNLETIIFCGEKLLTTTVKKLYERFGDINIINCYGPTECTFAVTSINISKDMVNENNIPIGIPKKDVDIYIVDENLNILEDGEIGEILISGESVAEGYVSLQSNNFIIYKNKKAYRTGDLGYIENGQLYYKRRKDKQLKYKGYRIELDDIEKNMYELDYIDRVVLDYKMAEDDKIIKIVAFVKIKDNIFKNVLEIRNDLLRKIPNYMCPVIKIVEEFPLNQNGKCDKKKLMEEYY